jgi:aspartyl-tRNA(Asn)/glutamyl-tRNA(Gln) amidotransferase subunit C
VSQEFDVEHFAKLARLSLNREDVPMLKKQMGDILDMVDSLSELNLENVEGTNFAVSVENVIRNDEQGKSLAVEAVVATFPETEDNHCKVPVMIEDNE